MTPNDPLPLRCLALTGSFETSKAAPYCFSGLAGNFDGMGMSFGALQWNLGQGTLQPLLSRMVTEHQLVTAKAFGGGSYIDSLEAMLAMPTRAAQIQWATSRQGPCFTFNEPWRSYFVALGQTPEFQCIEAEAAAGYYARARDTFDMFGLTTERGMALCFDIRVQNGGTSTDVQGHIAADFSRLAPDDEVGKLRSIANRRAEASNPKYIEDVRTRKLCIANGTGKVHGVEYDIDAQFGIGLCPVTPLVVS